MTDKQRQIRICKKLVGKTIKKIELNEFNDGRGSVAFDPTIIFEDGTEICFSVQETDDDYGVYFILIGRR